MSFVLAMLAVAVVPQLAPSVSAPAPAVAASADDGPTEDAARRWLALLDEAKWAESWAATAAPFRRLNTVAAWTAASQRVRAPLGAVRSRTLLGHDELPAPPHGYHVVRFRTDFVNRAGAVETVALDREDGRWRVVGTYVG